MSNDNTSELVSDERIELETAIADLIPEDEHEEPIVNLQNSEGNTIVLKEKSSVDGLKRSSASDDQSGPKKRLAVESGTSSTQPNFVYNRDSLSNVVAEHYNNIEEKGLNARTKTRIYFMRNFNNWVKTMLINEYLEKVKTSKPLGAPLRVLDMCCGKGGDLFKWQKNNITHLICADIADVSIEQCKKRYEDLKSKNDHGRAFSKLFTAEFLATDCTLSRLREKYEDPSVELDFVSCQFAFHYCFETLPQAERMLQNASECLRPGGYFIGTIPDAYEIVARKKESGSSGFGNEIYKIEFQCDDSNKIPLFGAKYTFQLDDVVDCPEFLVHFPSFIKLARKYGLELVAKERFDDLFTRLSESGAYLLNKMQSLETYPPFPNSTPSGENSSDYDHAKDYMDKNPKRDQKYRKIGTLSKSEWEAITLYMTFAFKKVKMTWNSEGKPEYIK